MRGLPVDFFALSTNVDTVADMKAGYSDDVGHTTLGASGSSGTRYDSWLNGGAVIVEFIGNELLPGAGRKCLARSFAAFSRLARRAEAARLGVAVFDFHCIAGLREVSLALGWRDVEGAESRELCFGILGAATAGGGATGAGGGGVPP